MKILIVDDEKEIVDSLAGIVAASGTHEVYGANSGEQAVQIVAHLGQIDVLVTDVVMQGMDGFVLRQNLLTACPAMQTIFITGYDLSEYPGHLASQKILNKPVNTIELLASIESAHTTIQRTLEEERAANSGVPEFNVNTANLSHLMQRQGFTGKLDQFQLVDIIQMCCLSRRSGRLRIAKGVEKGVLFLQDGRIVHAVSGGLSAEEAVYRVISWDFGEFSFDEGIEPPKVTIQSGWEHLVMDGVRRRDESRGIAHEAPEEGGLANKSIGDYKINRKLGEGEWGEVFEATQISVQRPVALKVLRQDLHLNPEAVQQFIADASAKANVQHPSIISVYEAGESNGVYFYAREFVDGVTVADISAQGTTLTDSQALQTIRVVAEALSYLNHYKIPHSELQAGSIFFGSDNRPRLANLSTVQGEQTVAVQKEIRLLSTLISSAMQEGASATPEVRSLLTKMKIEGNGGFLSWGALIQSVRALEPQVLPKDAYKLSAQDQAAVRAVEAEKKRQKRASLISTIGMIALFWVVLGVLFLKFFHGQGRDFKDMIEIPAGEFVYQDGKKMELPAFYIDKHEVTIGMYAKFLKALEKNPTTEFDNEKQPKGKSHKPFKWDLMLMAAKKKSVTYEGAHIDLNTPVFFLDWFDAYAYAKWRGHRLPTEQEWEKAARGAEGNLFPWGNEFDPKKSNSAIDMSGNPTLKGSVDGWNRWANVDSHGGDKSPYGVINMAGNVAEWTGSWAETTEPPIEVVPVIRGGSFSSQKDDGNPDVILTRRNVVLLAEQNAPSVGFRTASDTPPKK